MNEKVWMDGRIRTCFDSNDIHSGRISSDHPNLHVVGKEPVAGNNSVRSVMVASEGISLICLITLPAMTAPVL